MQGPFYRYLTNAYVEYLGLEPFMRPRPAISGWVGENARYPVKIVMFSRCVVYNHGLYAQASDGLSWDLQR